MTTDQLQPSDRIAAIYGYHVRPWTVKAAHEGYVLIEWGAIAEIWNNADLAHHRAIPLPRYAPPVPWYRRLFN